jgi:hypothetical protein
MAQLEKIVRPFVVNTSGQELYETYFSEPVVEVNTILAWSAETSVDNATNTKLAAEPETWAGSGITAEQVFLEDVEEEYDYFEVANPKDSSQKIWEEKLTFRTTTTWDVGPEWFSGSVHGKWRVKWVVEDVLNNTRITHYDDTYYTHRDNLQRSAYNYGRPPYVEGGWI